VGADLDPGYERMFYPSRHLRSMTMTAARGNRGEAAVLNALIDHGFDVLVPFGEGHPYDLVVDLGCEFLKVQCKTAWPKGGCLVFNTHATDHGHGALPYHGLADVFGVYSPSPAAVYLVPVCEVSHWEGRLRLTPTRNNQRRRVRLAADYEIGRWTHDRLRMVAASAAAA
jgi:hypothetical protein